MSSPVFFNFYSYTLNPIVEYCLSKYSHKTILSLDDCLPDILKLNYARCCYEHGWLSYIGDQLRLYYASQSDDFIYIDCDSIVADFEDLKLGYCAPFEHTGANEGSYFRANYTTDWVLKQLTFYEKLVTTQPIGNETVHRLISDLSIPTQHLNYTHFYFSLPFGRFPKGECIIYYTCSYKTALTCTRPIWLITNEYTGIINKSIFCISAKLPFEVFEAQLKYTLGNDNIKLIQL